MAAVEIRRAHRAPPLLRRRTAGAKNSAHCTHRVSALQWLGRRRCGPRHAADVRMEGECGPDVCQHWASWPRHPLPAVPTTSCATATSACLWALPVRVPHGQPDAGRGPQLAHLRADRLAAGPRPRRADARRAHHRLLALGRHRGRPPRPPPRHARRPVRDDRRLSPLAGRAHLPRPRRSSGRPLRAERGSRPRPPPSTTPRASPWCRGWCPPHDLPERARPQPRRCSTPPSSAAPASPACCIAGGGAASARRRGARGRGARRRASLPSSRRSTRLNALSFLAVIVALLLMRTEHRAGAGRR